jgi:DNA-binding response OmpR family regulator
LVVKQSKTANSLGSDDRYALCYAEIHSMDQPLNILAVDDEPSVGHAISFVLGCASRRMKTALDGHEALRRVATDWPPFDIIITDHNMPRISGLELVRQLRADNFRGKIVVLSAFLTDENRRAYTELQVDKMLAKPFNVAELRAAIDSLQKAA